MEAGAGSKVQAAPVPAHVAVAAAAAAVDTGPPRDPCLGGPGPRPPRAALLTLIAIITLHLVAGLRPGLPRRGMRQTLGPLGEEVVVAIPVRHSCGPPFLLSHSSQDSHHTSNRSNNHCNRTTTKQRPRFPEQLRRDQDQNQWQWRRRLLCCTAKSLPWTVWPCILPPLPQAIEARRTRR
jgi:hypothetical protein